MSLNYFEQSPAKGYASFDQKHWRRRLGKKTGRPMGRPPAEWVQKLAATELDRDLILETAEVAALFGVDRSLIYHFCKNRKIEGEYFIAEGSSQVRRRFRISQLREAAQIYLQERGVPDV